MNNILSLINPARIIKVEDAMKITESLIESNPSIMKFDGEREATALSLLQSFESLYALKLEKGHFVCEVEKPVEPVTDRAAVIENSGGMHSDAIDEAMFNEHHLKRIRWYEQLAAYEAAQAKVIFEGFEKTDGGSLRPTNPEFHALSIHSAAILVVGLKYEHLMKNPTIGDLFTEIERYNRTAATPIELKYTSNITKLLKIEG